MNLGRRQGRFVFGRGFIAAELEQFLDFMDKGIRGSGTDSGIHSCLFYWAA